MENQTNSLNQKATLFYARYAFKTQGLKKVKVHYEGLIDKCPGDLKQGLKGLENFKYIRIWQKAI
ncbi:MAG: hypothetical protein CL596_05145 [Alteromonas sp.]|nr:hypothetical protein [Alteromonas sp.]|tara:strand:- start:18220 stop:18414 length:195 start_codon:yes stop_codon:yes gene_type:complete